MNNRRDFDQSSFDGMPTMAAPAAGQQQGGWPQQAPHGEPGPHAPYVQPPQYGYPPPQYGPGTPSYEAAAQAPLPVYRRPGVVFGAAAVAAVVAVGAFLATWVSKDNVSTTPANTSGTPSQQAPVQLVPAPPSAPLPSQSVIVQKPIPRQQAPRQQAPAPRVVPSNPPSAGSSPVVPPPAQKPVAPPEDKQVPLPEDKQVPPPEDKQVPPPDDTQTPPDMNPGDPENPTPDDLLCHPNPPGCTGDQRAPAQPAP